jgi:type II secretory pathway component PulF
MWPVEVAVIWTVLLLFVIPHFREIFDQFPTPLPLVTLIVLRLAHFGHGTPAVALLWAMAIALPITLHYVYPYRSASRWVKWICIFFLLCTVVLFGTALGLPMSQLYTSPLGP